METHTWNMHLQNIASNTHHHLIYSPWLSGMFADC
jgi:hypothetical protein